MSGNIIYIGSVNLIHLFTGIVVRGFIGWYVKKETLQWALVFAALGVCVAASAKTFDHFFDPLETELKILVPHLQI